jgi:hypothetical protein
METVEEFLARGGKVVEVKEDERSNSKDSEKDFCDKQMRASENQRGSYSSYWGQQ